MRLTSEWGGGLSRIGCPTIVSPASSPTESLKRTKNSPLFPCLTGSLIKPKHFIFRPWTGIYIMYSLGSQAFRFGLNCITSFPGSPSCKEQTVGHGPSIYCPASQDLGKQSSIDDLYSVEHKHMSTNFTSLHEARYELHHPSLQTI